MVCPHDNGCAYFVNHVALWMPAFISVVPVDLDELFQNRAVTTRTFCSETG